MIFFFKHLRLKNAMRANSKFFLLSLGLVASLADAPDCRAEDTAAQAKAFVAAAEQQSMGDSLFADVSMTVERESSRRDLKFKIWLWRRDKAFVKIQEPLKDRGSGSLRLNLNLWQFLPNIGRVVRIPPSMMLQSWMGSDFTNDDLIKTSSLSRDYTHQFESDESLRGETVRKVVCTPKPDAPVVWGKVRLWLRPKDAVALRQEFFSERGELLKILEGTDVKTFGTHTMASTLTMSVLKKPGTKTVMKFNSAKFDESIPDQTFTQENLMRTGG
jgi:hypothetical protein